MNGEEAIRLIQAHMIAHNIGVYPHIRLAKALDMAISALRAQQEVESKLKVVESNAPLTLDELRQMDGEPVWIHFIGGAVIRNDGWFIISQIGTSEIFLSGKVSVYKNFWYYGETWVAYRQKPRED